MSTITTLNSTDSGATSRGVINTNFSNLNTDKVEGAASSTDNAIARFDGTGGKTLQNSLTTIDDNGYMKLTAGASTYVGLRLANTNGGTDEKQFDILNNATDVSFRLLNDAGSAANTAIQITRSGYTVSNVKLGNTTYVGNGSGLHAILSAGSIASSDKIFTFPNETGTIAVGTPWTTWNPTFANFTKGSATITARYTMIGKTVHYVLYVALAADSSMGASPTFTLPVTSSSTYHATMEPIGNITILDQGTGYFTGLATWATTTTAYLNTLGASQTYAHYVNFSSTAPMTWTTSDAFAVTGTYEAA